MANFDYSVEKKITLTNVAVDVAIDDAGTQPNAVGDKVIPGDRFIQYFGKNLWTKLAPGDSVTVSAKTSAESAFYFAQASKDITVEVATEETETTEEQDNG